MDIVGISEDNLEDFSPFLGKDLTEDLKRIFYNGIGAIDGKGQAAGAFVYELINCESEEDTKSRICMVKAGDRETADRLRDYYSGTSVKEDGIFESFYKLTGEAEARSLEEIGFSLEKREDDTLEVSIGELAETTIGKPKKLPDRVTNIERLSVLQFRDAVKKILFKGHNGIVEDISYLPKTWFDNDVSACVSSGGIVSGLFLVRRTPSGVLIPVLFFACGPESNKNLLHMLRYSLKQAIQRYPPETVVRIHRRSTSIKALTDNILPGRAGKEIFFGVRKEK